MSIKQILTQEVFSKKDIEYLLSIDNPQELELLRVAAYKTMQKHSGENVYLRGLIEFSNICINDCYYCGIRKSNQQCERYQLSKQEILDLALECAQKGYGSLVLQSGERQDAKFVDFVENVVRDIKEQTRSSSLPQGLGITLCVGEQSKEVFQRFFDAGAHRYLLRIESSSPELFAKIHPPAQRIETRLQALQDLREVGYQVGTGVMIGLPNQTIEQLADDILFFQAGDFDMFGMGPYISHFATPMGSSYHNTLMSFRNFPGRIVRSEVKEKYPESQCLTHASVHRDRWVSPAVADSPEDDRKAKKVCHSRTASECDTVSSENPFYCHRKGFPIKLGMTQNNKTTNFSLSLKMIAVLRLVMKDINIASTTALQTLKDDGYAQGLSFGANVMMPILTPVRFREQYALYNDKVFTADIPEINRHIALNEWGDSRHFFKR